MYYRLPHAPRELAGYRGIGLVLLVLGIFIVTAGQVDLANAKRTALAAMRASALLEQGNQRLVARHWRSRPPLPPPKDQLKIVLHGKTVGVETVVVQDALPSETIVRAIDKYYVPGAAVLATADMTKIPAQSIFPDETRIIPAEIWQQLTGPFVDYTKWMGRLEEERSRIRTFGLASVPAATAAPRTSAKGSPAPLQSVSLETQLLDQKQVAISQFENVLRAQKPRPPRGCEMLDEYYTLAMSEDAQGSRLALDALQNRDKLRLEMIRQVSLSRVDSSLVVANVELERACQRRRLEVPFHIKTGESASIMGSLVGADSGR